jgi:hypothetical protein
MYTIMMMTIGTDYPTTTEKNAMIDDALMRARVWIEIPGMFLLDLPVSLY